MSNADGLALSYFGGAATSAEGMLESGLDSEVETGRYKEVREPNEKL